MQFTRLRLTGFKSFVDPTELRIDPGLTGVVGPNGCGKSNLLEGLRWVMGETKPTNMRGEGMDDVIFAGTQNRSARNLADVNILLDNAQRRAPAEFNDEDLIEVSRRIERESGSAYRINGREVRARDVQILFADLATGAHSPALVSQGRIGAIINSKPKDRRGILEEAAGIGGLHTRRHEAELRLRATETNLERLRDTVVQLEAQLGSLKRQARQASRYRSLSDRLRQAEAMMLYLRWQHAGEAMDAATTELAELEKQVVERTGIVAKASTAQADAAALIPPLRDREAEAAASLHRISAEKDILDSEERRLQEQKDQLGIRIDQVRRDLDREQTYRDDSDTRLEALGKERLELEGRAQTAESRNNELDERVRVSSDDAKATETAFESLAQEIATARAEQEALQMRKSRTEKSVEELAASIEIATSERQGNQPGGALESQIEAAQKVVKAAIQHRDECRQALEPAAKRTEAAAEEEATARQAYQSAKDQLGELEAEERVLASLLDAGRDERFAPVLDTVEAKRGYETALGAAFGEDLDLPADAEAPAFWLNLPPIKKAAPLPEGATPLSKFVMAPKPLSRALSQIGVVESEIGQDLQSELAPGQSLVSRDGGFWRWDGRVAKPGTPTASAVRLEQRNRLGEIRNLLDVSRAKVSELEADHQQGLDNLAQIRSAETQCRQALTEAEDSLASQRDEEARFVRQGAEARSAIVRLDERIERLEADLGSAKEDVAQASEALAELGDLESLNASLSDARTDLEEKRDLFTRARAERDALHLEAQSRFQRLANIETEEKDWAARLQGTAAQIEDLTQRLRESESQLEGLTEQPEHIAEKRQSLEVQIEEASEARSTSAAALAEAESKLSEFDRTLRSAERELSEAREQRARAEALVEQAEERIQTVKNAMEETLDCAPDRIGELAEVKEGRDLPNMDDTARKLERLKRERETMGPVNLRAEIEAEEVQASLEELTREMADLEEAIGRLRRAISNLNREGRERMLAAFASVDAHFTDLFKRLFGGGNAHLSLTEAEDPLDAGLEIMASPPGKRLQHMSLLSGGEQALTALALIFAVFLTNPAPICVLDEVDAPLDDANVERFCDLLGEITRSTETRFLVVTHNPITMARLDRLYGVTMGERGVSQLVSVDLGQAEQLVAAE